MWAQALAPRRFDGMSDITAEMIAPGRSNDTRSPRRRRLSDRVRDTREQLMSAGAGQIVFDLELMRLYAEGRRAALWPQIILCLAVAAMAMVVGAAGLRRVMAASGVERGGRGWRRRRPLSLCHRARAGRASVASLRQPGGTSQAISVKSWRARFVFAEACNGLTWAEFRGGDDRSRRSGRVLPGRRPLSWWPSCWRRRPIPWSPLSCRRRSPPPWSPSPCRCCFSCVRSACTGRSCP